MNTLECTHIMNCKKTYVLLFKITTVNWQHMGRITNGSCNMIEDKHFCNESIFYFFTERNILCYITVNIVVMLSHQK